LRVKYLDGGEGQAVVLLHGLLGSPAYLEPLARALARSRRVIVPALPGHGGSDPIEPFTFEAASDLLAAAVRELGIDRPTVLGHSFGAPLAVYWAARHKVRSLIAVSSIGIAPLQIGITRAFVPAAPAVALAARALARPLAVTPAGRRFVFGWFVGMARPQAVEAELGERLIRGAAQASAQVAGVLPVLDGLDLRPTAAQVGCRSLVIWGERDGHGLLNGAALADALRGERRILPDVGHMPMLEAPFAFRRSLAGFV
jgi:pimeloyl-ACP methyl ester carboxylesterase